MLKTPLGSFFLIMASTLLLAGCSPTPVEVAERKLLSEYHSFKRDARERDVQKEALEYWRRKAVSAGADRRTAEAEREYNRLALSGRAGTSEHLIAARKVMDDPASASRLSTSGPQQSEVDYAWNQATTLRQTYDFEARKVHDQLLPPLAKAASEYKAEYDTAVASGKAPAQSLEVREALSDLRSEVAQDGAWVLSVKLREQEQADRNKGSKKK